MIKILYAIVLIITFAISIEGNNDDFFNDSNFTSQPNTLQMVHVIFRHGERTNDINTIYPNDPYKNYTYFPTGIGELTLEGKRTMYRKVGQPLRERYNEFLGDIYYPGILEARSTEVRRAQTSLLVVLAALFQPSESQMFEEDLNWQPIPIEYRSYDNDLEFFAIMSRKGTEVLNEYRNSTEYQETFKKYQNIADYVKTNTGWTMNDMSLFCYLYFGLTSEKESNLDLPMWTKLIYPQPLKMLAELSYYDYSGTDDLTRLSAGHMLLNILTDFELNSRSYKTTKIHLLSGHEFNIASMLLLLDVFEPHVPPYGSHIIFELHKINQIYGYMIYYHDFKNYAARLLDIPNCGEFCPVDKFKELYGKFIPLEN